MNQMEQLSTFFKDLESPLQQKINSFFQKKEFEKGDFFVQEGRTNTHLGFIAKGVFQYFYLREGDEVTSYMVGENNFMASLTSFIQQIPSKENIRALTPATVWQISKKHLQEIIDESEQFKVFYINLLEYQLVCIDKSRIDFIMLNAEQRYEKMLGEEPHLLQQIPLQYLASMLGVTPRHLSRIRKNIR
jgi:CRP/FNR family transcriptional regulator, anaerobic regulatory protein